MPELNGFERDLILNVEKFGWHAMLVGAGEGDPNFAYSVGFSSTLGGPEVIIFGLKSDVLHSMLWQVFDAAREGRKIEGGTIWSDVLDGYECEMRSVHPSRLREDWFNSSLWYWRRYLGRSEAFSACQLFWPGVEDHLLPWAPGAHPSVLEAQPRLDRPGGH